MKPYLRTLSYLRPYKFTIVVTWFISLMVLALQGISVWVGASFIEKLLIGKSSVPIDNSLGTVAVFLDELTSTILQQATPFKSLIAAVAVLLGSAFLTTFFRVMKTFLFAGIIQSILNQIRKEMFDHLTRLDLSFSQTNRPGEISSLFINDTDQLKAAIIDSVDRLFMQPIRLLMAATLMLSLSVELTMWAFSFLIISSLVIHFAGNRIECLTCDLMERTAKIQGHITEYLSTVILARSLGREKYERKRFTEACNLIATKTIKLDIVRSLAPQLINNLYVLSGGILLLVGGYKVLVSQTITGGLLVKMVLLLPVATYPIESLASLYLSVRGSIASAKRVFGLLDQDCFCEDSLDATQPQPFKQRIDLNNVSYCVNEIKIIENLSMTIPRGSKTVIFGPSGAGKTTILGLISGLIRPTSGSILIDSIDLKQIKGLDWRRKLGVIIQEPIFLNGSVKENLHYACPDANDEKLITVLKEVLLWEDKCVFPNGLQTQVGNRGEFLSGGERQRLNIARSLLNNPEILLMDEPTAMLDIVKKSKIRDTILSVARNRTLILVTHDPYLREIVDQEIQIKSGKIV